MTLKEIADELVKACRSGETRDLVSNHYAADAESAEPFDMPGAGSRVTQGIDGILGKHDWWENAFEMHGFSVDGPYPHGDDKFAVIFEVDATEKATDERTQMKEVAVYHVKDGKIVREEFFYGGP